MSLQFEEFYQNYLDAISAYNLALSTLATDQQTIAPHKGADYANQMSGILAQIAFELENDPQTIKQIEEYAGRLKESSREKKEVDLRLEHLEESKNIPASVYGDYVHATKKSQTLWHTAKEKADYSMFKDTLKDVMNRRMQLKTYSPRFDGTNGYELMLDDFEKGMDSAQYDAFFDVIKEELVPFIHRINQAKPIDTAFLAHPVEIGEQAKFNETVLDFLGRDTGKVYLSTTEHPFTDFFSRNDVRITTHYYPDQFLSAILSTVHEYGHALYNMQMDEDLEGTMFDAIVGSAAHESQSRFLENHIGRSLGFWKALYPLLCEQFEEFKDVTPEDLWRMVNASQPSLIRTEADELTYPLHILIRYEIEKMIADGSLDYDRLPEIWADKYEEYLGVRPKNDAQGVLQDIHWSGAELGYFPTYALGSAYAAQLYEAMCKSLNPDEELEKGNAAAITEWLKDNVHHHGGTKSMKEIVEEVSGKPFDPHIYTSYLKDKYSKLYQLEPEQ